MKIVLLEDEANIRDFLSLYLRKLSYEVVEAKSIKEMKKIMPSSFDLAILDVMLPDGDGNEMCRLIREKDKRVGIIMLTAKSQEMDKLNSFRRGADDYITKPFHVTELVARIEALKRRMGLKEINAEELKSKDITINLRERLIVKNQKDIRLTNVEYRLLVYLFENKNKALSRDELLNAGWGEDFIGDYKIVDVNIRRLRKKIEDDPSNPKYIVTIWGYGYKWSDFNEG